MADKSVGELIAAQSVTPTDLFVLEQNGTAKKLTGQILENWMVSFADGHGGIQNIEKVSTDVLADTYRITLSDTTTFDFVVTNGRSIDSIEKTNTSGLVDTYTITYNNGTTSKFTVTNGAKGDKGDNSYVWIKYASQEPTESSHSIGDIPDDWIGIYSGNASTAPTDWKQYKWFQIKGEKGNTGEAATLVTKSVTYQVSDSGTIIPSGSWGSSIPEVSQGKYLWTKTELRFNTGDPIVSYSVARMGIDGTGSVSSVAGVSPGSDGNVALTAADIGALPTAGGNMEGPINMNGQAISGLNAPTEDTQAATKGYVDGKMNQTNEDITGLGQDVYGSEQYNATTTYSFGGYCIYDNKLWKCKAAHQGVAPPNETYWEYVSLSGLNAGMAEMMPVLLEETQNNISSISVNISNISKSPFPRVFVLEMGIWNSSETFGAIGFYRYSVSNNECNAIIFNGSSGVTSVGLTSEGVFTANFSGAMSYVCLKMLSI